jgi:hypothetical protein
MKAAEVLDGQRLWSCEQGDAIEWLAGLPADSVDCFISSPPYLEARLYLENGKNLGVARKCQDWIAWMIEVSIAAQRVVRGPMFWVVAGSTKKRNYQPGPEGLMYEWWQRGGDCQLYRPCVFHRIGIPGSGGDDYLRADWEYVVCMKRPGKLPWSDNTACGHPPKWAPGGEMSYRLSDGTRTNQWGKTGTETGVSTDAAGCPIRVKPRPSHRTVTKRLGRNMANGIEGSTKGGCVGRRVTSGHKDGDTPNEDAYLPPVKANPGTGLEAIYTASEVAQLLADGSDWRHCKVGGGLMGHKLAHQSEAPMPTTLSDFFVLSFCQPGGICCDPFAGSGTVAQSALANGRRFVGADLRASQVALTRRRLEGITTPLFT